MHTHPSIYPGISMIPKRCTLAHAYYTDRRSCIALILFGVPVPTGTSNAWLVRFYLRTPVKGSIGSNRFACLDSMIPCSIFPVAASSRVFRTRLTPPNRLSCAQDSHRQVMRRAARSVSHSAWLLHHRSERWTPLSCILCHILWIAGMWLVSSLIGIPPSMPTNSMTMGDLSPQVGLS